LPESAGKARVLLMGNEQQGLTDELAAACDHKVKIPMLGKLESLNLATATAVMLYEMQKEKMSR
jgi:TrmH family RNA methyltransferase